MVHTVTTQEVEQHIRNTRIIDLRDREFYYLGHIEGACWLPFYVLLERAEEVLHPDEPVIFYDGGVNDWRARDAVETLERMGFDRVMLYSGGWQEWEKVHPTSLKDSFTV